MFGAADQLEYAVQRWLAVGRDTSMGVGEIGPYRYLWRYKRPTLRIRTSGFHSLKFCIDFENTDRSKIYFKTFEAFKIAAKGFDLDLDECFFSEKEEIRDFAREIYQLYDKNF